MTTTKQQALEKIGVLKDEILKLEKIVSTPDTPTIQDKEQLFRELTEGIYPVINRERYPDSIFFCKDGSCIAELNGRKLHLHYYRYWRRMTDRLDMSYDQVKKFTREMVDKVFNLKGIVPSSASSVICERWKDAEGTIFIHSTFSEKDLADVK